MKPWGHLQGLTVMTRCFAFLFVFSGASIARASVIFELNYGPLVDVLNPTPLSGASMTHTITIASSGTTVGQSIPIESWVIKLANAPNPTNNGSYSVTGFGGQQLVFGPVNLLPPLTNRFGLFNQGALPLFTLNDGTEFRIFDSSIEWDVPLNLGVNAPFSISAADFSGVSPPSTGGGPGGPTTIVAFVPTLGTFNDSARIGAFGSFSVSDGATAVPEPSSVIAMGAMGLVAGWRARRRRRLCQKQPVNR